MVRTLAFVKNNVQIKTMTVETIRLAVAVSGIRVKAVASIKGRTGPVRTRSFPNVQIKEEREIIKPTGLTPKAFRLKP